MIRVSFLSRPILESIPECAEYILITLRNAFPKFRTNALIKRFRIGETGASKGFKTRARARAATESSEKVYVCRDGRSRGRKWLR